MPQPAARTASASASPAQREAVRSAWAVLTSGAALPLAEFERLDKALLREAIGTTGLDLVCVDTEDHDGESIVLLEERRALPGAGVDGAWVHVARPVVAPGAFAAPVDWARSIETLHAEMCVSSLDGPGLFVGGGPFVAVVLAGAVVAHYGFDCWSCVCSVTGKRYATRDWSGCPHDEAWLVPAQARVACYVTDCPRVAAALRDSGRTVVESSAGGLSGGRESEAPKAAPPAWRAPCRVRGMHLRELEAHA